MELALSLKAVLFHSWATGMVLSFRREVLGFAFRLPLASRTDLWIQCEVRITLCIFSWGDSLGRCLSLTSVLCCGVYLTSMSRVHGCTPFWVCVCSLPLHTRVPVPLPQGSLARQGLPPLPSQECLPVCLQVSYGNLRIILSECKRTQSCWEFDWDFIDSATLDFVTLSFDMIALTIASSKYHVCSSYFVDTSE